ncbi:MAG: hypothetical protein FK732_01285 [Asgard group archaeon]|nr:hypothetical protein [Asgard group archaeon]
MNQFKMQKQIFCFVILLIFMNGIVIISSSANYRNIRLNSSFGETISLNSDISRGGSTIFANGSLVYLLEEYYGFEIYDVSIKDEPEVVGKFNYSLDLTWDYSNMIVQGNYVYFFSQDINRITILDCSNVTDVKLKVHYTLPAGTYKQIAVLGWSILAITSTEFRIYNYTNFAPILLIDSYSNASSSFSDLTVQGNYSYILDSDYGLAIFNITDLANITKANDLVINEIGAFSDFYVTEDYVYIFEEQVGLHVFDISNPITPSNVTKYEITDYTIADILIEENYAYLVYWRSFDILNVSNLLDIQPVSTYTSEYIAVFESISVDSNFAYLTSIQSGELQDRRPLYIADITNLESPVHVYPGDPYKFLSDLARLLLIIAGVLLGVPIVFLAIFIPVFLRITKKK